MDAPTTDAARGEIDLAALLGRLWRGRWIIAAVTGAAVLLAVLYLHLATYKYTARLTLTPVQNAGGDFSSGLGGLGGLASLAGVSLPQDSSALAFSLYAEGVHSRMLADALTDDTQVMQVIFEQEWDAGTRQFQAPGGFVPATVTTLKAILGAQVSAWQPPDGARLQEFLVDNVGVSQDSRQPYIGLTFDHKDPEFATYLLEAIHQQLDGLLREKALLRTGGNIDYLSEQLGRVTVAEHRQAIAAALSEQEKQRMSASSSAPYAADPFGSASASRRPTSPSPARVLVGGFVLGVFAGAALALWRFRAF